MENLKKTKKTRLTSNFYLGHHGGWGGGGGIKQNENDWKFNSYKGTNLGYDVLYKSLNSDQEEKSETY